MIRQKDNIIQESEFPFNISDVNGQNDELPMEMRRLHNHDCLEISYVIQGGGQYLVGDKRFELRTGDICIVNNQEYHMMFNAGMLLKVMVFNIDLVWNGSQMDYMYLKAFFERSEQELPFLKGELPITKAVASVISDIDYEWKEKKPGYRILIKADLLKMLGMIYRYYEETESFCGQKAASWANYHSVIRVVDYINDNYSRHLTLGEMAEMVHMSENYFSGIFSEVLKMPFSRYVLEKRLSQACILLKTTDRPVIEIALLSGFETISYFNKTFKEKYGCTPGRYRAEYKSAENSTTIS